MSFNITGDTSYIASNVHKSKKRHKEKERDVLNMLLEIKKKKKNKKSKKSEKQKKNSKRKKHKKDDRKLNKKFDSDSNSDSDSGSDSDLDSYVERELIMQKKDPYKDNDQGIMEFALFATSGKTHDKKSDSKNKCITDKPGQSARELNPYWKDGGSGLPEEKKVPDKDSSRLSFKKPSEETFSSSYLGERRRNWMKKSTEQKKTETSSTEKDAFKDENRTGKILTDSELNALAAKVVKAEILGNEALVKKLKSELDEAKKRRAEAESQGRITTEKTETIILTKTNRQGFTVPAEILTEKDLTGSKGRKKRKVETHDGGQRQRYFADDDKYSLKDMFVKEKAATAEDEERATVKKLSKGSKRRKGNRDEDEEEEIYLDAARCEESDVRRKTESLNEAKAKQKSLEGCKWCLENKNKSKHLIVEIGNKCYLSLPEETSLTEGHCLIVPIYHTPCSTATDEDVWEEMQTFRKKLCDLFSETGKEPVFFENARGLNRFPHMVLNCVPVDKEEADLAPIYFKKALLESETEWSNNKKVVDLKTKDVRKSIPKGLSYFAVDFGREGGFAHVIEDERLFPSNFAEEIIGGMLDLDHRIWRKQQKQDFNAQRDKFLKFIKMFRSFNSRSVEPKNDSSCSNSD